MVKTLGTFGYRILAPKKDDDPFRAIVHIIPKDYGTDREGWPLLSPQLVHEGEIDWYIQAFKDDLDRVGRLAKAALKRANQRTHERVRERLSVSD